MKKWTLNAFEKCQVSKLKFHSPIKIINQVINLTWHASTPYESTKSNLVEVAKFLIHFFNLLPQSIQHKGNFLWLAGNMLCCNLHSSRLGDSLDAVLLTLFRRSKLFPIQQLSRVFRPDVLLAFVAVAGKPESHNETSWRAAQEPWLKWQVKALWSRGKIMLTTDYKWCKVKKLIFYS